MTDGKKASLEDRHAREERYHDEAYTSTEAAPRHYDYHPTAIVFQALATKFGDLTGKDVLEYGCGAGWTTAELLSRGARVQAFDISSQAIEKARAFLERCGMRQGYTLRKMAAEKLDYPDESFDLVFGNAIIHHLDLGIALPEMWRIMKPGARALFAEPLGSNPAINLYRRLTPRYRTPDERPLILRELEEHARRFSGFTHEEYFVLALAPFVLIYIPGLRGLFRPTLKPFLWLDRKLLRAWPGAGNWAWYSVLEFTK